MVGWKATGRGRPGTELADTLALLDEAASPRPGRAAGLGVPRLVFDRVLEAGVHETMHLTPEPQTFLGACPPRLAVAFGRGRRELEVAAEVHADGLADLPLLERAVDEMRGWGWRIVLADVADEADALRAVDLVRPDIVQVDLSRPGRSGSAAVCRYLDAALDGRRRGDGARRRLSPPGAPRPSPSAPPSAAGCCWRASRPAQRARRCASQVSASG